jgi:hypothetical protein
MILSNKSDIQQPVVCAPLTPLREVVAIASNFWPAGYESVAYLLD